MGIVRCPHCQEMIPDDFDHCGFCGKDVHVNNKPYMLQIGTILQDRYYIGAAIGQGGFGITYSCCDLRLDMKVAIKEYYPDRLVKRNTSDSNDIVLINSSKQSVYDHEMDKCLLEARTLGDFADDPGVVRVSDIFNQNKTVYIVMEYLEGMTLEQFRKRNPEVDFDFCYKMLNPVIKVLEHIHERGLIHRDISPSNIMVLPDGRAKLLDFGSASRYDEPTDNEEILVLREGYSPIEQYQKGVMPGPWTDVYAFCATFYYMLTGINPISADERVNEDKLEKPSQMGVDILGGQEDALMHGLAVSPDSRTKSMEQLEDEMELRVPVIIPKPLEQSDEIEKHLANEVSGLVKFDLSKEETKNESPKKLKKKKVIKTFIAAALLCVCIAALLTYKRINSEPKLTSHSLIESTNLALSGSDKIKLTIKANASYQHDYSSYYSYNDSVENEEVVEVWSGLDDSIYVLNNGSAKNSYIGYMTLTHIKGDTYSLCKHEANAYEIDNGYEAYIIPMLLDGSCLNGNMNLSEDQTKINGNYYYEVSGELNTNTILNILDETNIFGEMPGSFAKNNGLIPKTVIKAYIDTEDYSLRRVVITMTNFDEDKLSEISTRYNESYSFYKYDKIKATITVDYSYGDKAELSEFEARRFTNAKAKATSGSDVTWAYKWAYIWNLDILYIF